MMLNRKPGAETQTRDEMMRRARARLYCQKQGRVREERRIEDERWLNLIDEVVKTAREVDRWSGWA